MSVEQQSSNQNPSGGRAHQPGAMTMAMQAVQIKTHGPRVLHIGISRNDKLIEQKVIRARETVHIGASEDNHFILTSSSIPAKFPLFQVVGSDYILNFTEEMSGRIALPSGVHELSSLRSTGSARNAGSHWQVKLNENSRGHIRLGDTGIIFQFVPMPAAQVRPQLPAAARGGLSKSVDWVFAAFLMFSFMSMLAFIVFLENADWPADKGLAEMPDSVARMIFSEPPPPPEPEEEKPTEETKDAPTEQVAEQPRTKDTSQDTQAKEEKTATAEGRAKIVDEAAQAAEAMLLGALGAEGTGALADVLAGGAVTGNAEDVLAQAAGVGVATSGAGSLRTRNGGSDGSGVGGLGSLARAGGEGATQEQGGGTKVVERVVRGNINLGSGEDIGGTGEFDSSVVVKTIKTRIRAIQACYEKELRRNPSLEGKVTVQFTIQESGSVTNAKATENSVGDPAVAECVVSTVSRFRFNPGPEGGSVTFSYPFVFKPQG